jgi:hypothetical protein
MVLEAYLGDRIRDLAEELRDFLEDAEEGDDASMGLF